MSLPSDLILIKLLRSPLAEEEYNACIGPEADRAHHQAPVVYIVGLLHDTLAPLMFQQHEKQRLHNFYICIGSRGRQEGSAAKKHNQEHNIRRKHEMVQPQRLTIRAL